MAIRAVNTYTQTVTPEIAQAFLACNFDKQRRVDYQSVHSLARAMKSGQFTTNTIKFAILNSQRVMTNGQHTLLAVIESGSTVLLPVADFVVDSQDDIAKLYFHEDTQRRRNFGDSIRALALPESLKVSPTDIKRCASALKWIKGSFGVVRQTMNSISYDDFHEWVPLWINEAKLISAAISPCENDIRNMITAQSLYSVALITARYRPDMAVEFWKQVAQDDKLERYDPRKTIRNWCIANRAIASNDYRISGYVVSRAAILAWNAWIDGRTLRYINVKEKAGIVSIYGTPYNGRQSADFLSLNASPERVISALREMTS